MGNDSSFINEAVVSSQTVSAKSSTNNVWNTGLLKILEHKNLSLELFHKDNTQHLSFDSDINEHAKWLFNNIYKIPYPVAKQEVVVPGFSRYAHGLTHVSRAAHYIPVFANLYRKHRVKDSDTLTEEDIKLLQIAALFHDSAREDENEDQWDHESALLLYHYLRQVLRVNKEKACLIAEATANKDLHKTGYFRINEGEDGQISWQFDSSITKDNYQKSIYHQLIHDVDCLDIIRARPAFDAKYLDFYQIAAKDNPLALEEMAQLICEARSLITYHGDSYGTIEPSIKINYEQENGFQAIAQDIKRYNYPVLKALSKELLPIEQLSTMPLVELTPYDPQKELTQENLEAALRDGKILARSIIYVSEEVAFNSTSGIKGNKAQIEIEKSMRRPGVATPSSKPDRFIKHGNPYRSVSLLGYGAGLWSNVGFLMINPNPADIQLISSVDADTGYQKKSIWNNNVTQDIDVINQQYADLHQSLKLGGQYRRMHNGEFTTHSELLYHCKKIDAIYFTQDQTPNNPCLPPYFGLLQAVYLRNEYETAYNKAKAAYILTYGPEQGEREFITEFGEKKKLPIIEYSSRHNQIHLTAEQELDDELLIQRWTAICSRYIRTQVSHGHADVLEDNLEAIKVKSMYFIHEYQPDRNYSDEELQKLLHQTDYYLFNKRYIHGNRILPADSNYPVHLRERINLAIEQERQTIAKEMEDRLYDDLLSEQHSILSEHSYALIMQSTRLQDKLKNTRGVLEQLFNNIPVIPTNKSDAYAYNPMIGASKNILRHGRTSKDPYYGTPVIPNVCISLDKQIKLIRTLNLDMNVCLYPRINAESKLDKEDIFHLVYGQCSLIFMSEEPTNESQRTSTESQYIITENRFYYYDKLNEILHEIPINENQRTFLHYYRALAPKKLSFEQLSRITCIITAYSPIGQFKLSPELFSLIVNKIKNDVFSEGTYDNSFFQYTYQEFCTVFFELLKLLPGGNLSLNELHILEHILAEIQMAHSSDLSFSQETIEPVLLFFREKIQKEQTDSQQSGIPESSFNETINTVEHEVLVTIPPVENSSETETIPEQVSHDSPSFLNQHLGKSAGTALGIISSALVSSIAAPPFLAEKLASLPSTTVRALSTAIGGLIGFGVGAIIDGKRSASNAQALSNDAINLCSTSKLLAGLSANSNPEPSNRIDIDPVYTTIYSVQTDETELQIENNSPDDLQMNNTI
ncbi:SidE phosphodiesterase domain-containing protein [Legionella bononiensis]|uniref:HD domain-containing protein n=1 Tax=Legionella bononiensis TaxID=2793102 RepID=A0ABS1W8A6_9GAMM|nr:SidE phosphodiesterase domain-containing protein [Legionella bononiensis]MBL7479909.1 HD domain-containing protein [Legionella bononiensis]MBL7525576.1 HD domain-containing protein [Legionella bononiensis]MBL7561760.1 HD domain-containing protein [Legionella bononiensis]